jgi:GNAT superfamily N-acetyltransferase
MNYTIRKMLRSDIEPITKAFVPMNKTREQYERYFAENQAGERVTLVAVTDESVVGYANVLWRSYYEPFRLVGIPEINDLNVVEEYRDNGIGRALIAECEGVVRETKNATIGIGVGLTRDYSAAQHLYPALGYVSDGRGVYTSPHGDEAYFLKELQVIS